MLVLFSRVEDQEFAQQQLSRELALARQEGAEWRSRVQDLMRGLSGAIDQQTGGFLANRADATG